LSRKSEKVLVLGDGVAAFLSVVRSLGRQGLEVHVAWCQPDSPTLSSRYVSKFHRMAPPDSDGDGVDSLAQLLAEEKFDLVIPTNEQSIRALYPFRERLSQAARICLMDQRCFDVLFDKVKCSHLADSLGLHVPRSVVVENLEELLRAADKLGYPLVLKPVSSYDPTQPTRRRSVEKAYHPTELEDRGRRLLAEGPIQVQENFIGHGVGVELLVDRGEILLAFQHERVHQPLRGGASSYRKSVPLDAALLAASRAFVEAVQYSGVIMLEYLHKPTGEWRFVEANARFWGSLPLAIAAGADFPFALYQYLVHGTREFSQDYRTNLYCREIVGDGLWLLDNLRADRSDPTLATLSPASIAGEVRHVLAGRERIDTFTLDDPKPLFAQLVKYARRPLRRARLRLSEKLASRPGARRKESEAAVAALRNARQVIFLCWGNICRSPFAGLYARQAWPAEIAIQSRGLYLQRGRTSPGEAIEAARRLGIELDEHRSTILTSEEVRAADAIITFDEQIRRELLRQHPAARGKVFRFGALGKSADLSVDDPLGEDVSTFVEIYSQIKMVLDEAAQSFAGKPPAEAMVDTRI
jgi:protein-tyrosine-phosphatase/predicted ATP-grasp superfamily ATP-dependent carboligase